jgi:hypothetical protein
MPRPFKGTINLDIRDSTPDWDAFLPNRAPEGAPAYVDLEREMAAAMAHD